jgi:hypothetical protein
MYKNIFDYTNTQNATESTRIHSRETFRNSTSWVIAMLLISIAAPGAWRAEAKNGPGTVPQAVLNAHSVYVENQTTDAQLQTAVYAELTKWGRYQIADTSEKADLILRLSNGNIVRLVSGDATNTPSTEAKPTTSAPQVADETVPPGCTRLTLVDPKTGIVLWSGQRKTSGSPATWHLLDGLREAIEKSRNAK